MTFLSNEKIETLKDLVQEKVEAYESLFRDFEREAKGGKIVFTNLINERIDELSHLKDIQQDLEDILNAKPHVE